MHFTLAAGYCNRIEAHARIFVYWLPHIAPRSEITRWVLAFVYQLITLCSLDTIRWMCGVRKGLPVFGNGVGSGYSLQSH